MSCVPPRFWPISCCRYVGDTRIERKQSRFYSQSYTAPNPIITVTEHTPTPSPDFMKRQVERRRGEKKFSKFFKILLLRFYPIFPFDQGSIDSQLDVISMHGSRLDSERKPSLTRSQTDSNITYASDEIPEAPGSCCYITKEGDIDLQVVLKVGFRSIVLIEFFLWIYVLKLSFFIRQFTRSPCGTVIVVLWGCARTF